MIVPQKQIDALNELINIGVGQAASRLSTMLDTHIRLAAPEVMLLRLSDVAGALAEFGDGPLAMVQMPFRGPIAGVASLLFPPEDASRLVDTLTGQAYPNTDMDSLRAGTLSEVGNIVLNGVMGTIANFVDEHLEYSPPTYLEDVLPKLFHLDRRDPAAVFVLARVRFLVEKQEIQGNIVLYLEVGFLDWLTDIFERVIEKSHG